MIPFHPFGADHLSVLVFTIVVALGFVLLSPQIRRLKSDRWFRYGLAFEVLVVGIAAWTYGFSRGYFWIPFELCDLTIPLLVWALLGTNPYVREVAFFWGLAGSSQALITPDLHEAFPHFSWFTFFLGHAGMVLGAVYLSASGCVKVSKKSVWRAWLITNGYVLVAGFMNWQYGTNFGYLAAKPTQPNLLDYLGPWPYYIFWGELIALVLFFLCYRFSQWVESINQQQESRRGSEGN